ncbi:MAG: hypothetical protein JWQ74_2572 [Marmoricola sp.]|nr:hypothetical protein [Marmoricola sp.]
MKTTPAFRRIALTTGALALAGLALSACGDTGDQAALTAASTTPSATPATDPGSLAAGCATLVRTGDLVGQALAFGRTPDGTDRSAVQEKLFAVVTAGNKNLADAAGQLVDFLDDPEAYVDGGTINRDVTRAAADIRGTCAKAGS